MLACKLQERRDKRWLVNSISLARTHMFVQCPPFPPIVFIQTLYCVCLCARKFDGIFFISINIYDIYLCSGEATSSAFGRVEQHLIRNNDPFIQNGPKWTVIRYLSLPICGACVHLCVCMDMVWIHLFFCIAFCFFVRVIIVGFFLFFFFFFSSATRRELNTNFRMLLLNVVNMFCKSTGSGLDSIAWMCVCLLILRSLPFIVTQIKWPFQHEKTSAKQTFTLWNHVIVDLVYESQITRAKIWFVSCWRRVVVSHKITHEHAPGT